MPHTLHCHRNRNTGEHAFSVRFLGYKTVLFPLTGNITLFGNLDTKAKNRLNFNVSVSNIGSWKNRVTSFVDSDDFTRRSTLINKSVPISFSLSYFFGKFEAKEVRKTKGKSVIEGFSGQD